jgi:exonuclease III
MLILLGNDISENPGPFDNEISIFHLNIRNIRHKLDYVEALALGSSIVCITESHLDNTVLSRDIQIQGYHEDILRKDRNCFGGRVLVYFSETLKVKRREDLEFENSEMIWVEIEFPNYKVLLCVVYRFLGATQSFWQNFEYSIEEAFNYTTNVIITGDLNIDT